MPGNLIQAAAVAFDSNALQGWDVGLLGGGFYISTGRVAK